MPWHDWQFWLVTIAAALSGWRLARMLISRPRLRAVKGKRAALTIEGRPA
jgi:hypothetical protein